MQAKYNTNILLQFGFPHTGPTLQRYHSMAIIMAYLVWFNSARPPSYGWLSHSSLKCRLLTTQEWAIATTCASPW